MIRPTNEAELSEAIGAAPSPFWVSGGGSRGRAAHGRPLSTRGLSGITLYEPAALTLVAGAGTPLAEIEAMIAAEGQMLAFEPCDLGPVMGHGAGLSTLGGIAATNASGPRRVQAGAARDSLIGCRFVSGTGEVIANGGRVMKNVTGYDLVKLLAGSHGTLGVLSEVSLKLTPRPETEASLRISGLDIPQAQAVMAAALRSPYGVSGLALRPEAGEAALYLRLEGFESHLPHRTRSLQSTLAQEMPATCEIAPITGAASRQIWAEIRDLKALTGAGLITRTSLRPSRLRDLHAALRAELAQGLTPSEAAARIQIDWGGGLVTVGLHEADLRARPEDGRGVIDLLRAFSAREGGHTSILKRPETLADLPRFQPEPAAIAALSQGLRRKFDPRGILNPGLMD